MMLTLAQYLLRRGLVRDPLFRKSLTQCSPWQYWNAWDVLQVQDGLLVHCFVRCDVTGDNLQFLVPEAFCITVLYYDHDSIHGGY